jgi:chromosome segregation ATPase
MLNEANSKLADHEATIVALTSSQAKFQSEANELGSQLSEAESKAGTLSKAKSGLEAQVEDLKSELETESSVSWPIILFGILILYNLLLVKEMLWSDLDVKM